MDDKIQISSELSRELTLFQITMMGLGMMIGAGVFLGIGNSIFLAGPGGVILTFVLNGVIAIMTACSYAELSRVEIDHELVLPDVQRENNIWARTP